MALFASPLLIALVRSVVRRPSDFDRRRFEDRLRRERDVKLSGALFTIDQVSNVRCWSVARQAALTYVNSRLGELNRRVRHRCPVRTGRARESVDVGLTHLSESQWPILVNMEFDVGTVHEVHCAITVPYAQYLRGVRKWFFQICAEWYEETSRESFLLFLATYSSCAR